MAEKRRIAEKTVTRRTFLAGLAAAAFTGCVGERPSLAPIQPEKAQDRLIVHFELEGDKTIRAIVAIVKNEGPVYVPQPGDTLIHIAERLSSETKYGTGQPIETGGEIDLEVDETLQFLTGLNRGVIADQDFLPTDGSIALQLPILAHKLPDSMVPADALFVGAPSDN